MKATRELLGNNRRRAARMRQGNRRFFKDLARRRTPKHRWIGCAGSRVPANATVGPLPGEILVHRTVANLVVSTGINCLSVLRYPAKE